MERERNQFHQARGADRNGGHQEPRKDGKARILIMGLKRSGKSSISSVILHKVLPGETLYLESTTQITKDSMHSFMDFEVLEFPAQVTHTSLSDIDEILAEVGSVVWVIDAQDEYFNAIERLNATILELHQLYPAINIEVFVHKVDGLSDDFRGDIYRDIQQHVLDEMADRGLDNVAVSFHQTSIYDHTIYEAFSKVLQRLIPQLWALENLLNSLCSSSKISKAYLFDFMSKLYVASDASPGDLRNYETCSDYIDMVLDLSDLYGWERPTPAGGEDPFYDEYGNSETESLITMERRGNGYLYLREINRYLFLVCVMGEDDPTATKAIVDFNVGVFQKAVNKVVQK